MNHLLEVKNVDKSYPGVKALQGVNLSLKEGEIMALIGPNGAGKTTLFSVISGEIVPEKGTVFYKNVNVTNQIPWKRVRMGIGRCFQVARILPEMTAEENVLIAVQAYIGWQKSNFGSGIFRPSQAIMDKTRNVLGEVGLLEKRNLYAKTFSHGDKKRLELAMVLAQEPELLLLDEPTAGMSPEETRATVDLIAYLHTKRRFTIFLTEHDMEVVFRIADRVTVLHHGEIIATGKPEEIRENSVVQEVYLGKEGDFDAFS